MNIANLVCYLSALHNRVVQKEQQLQLWKRWNQGQEQITNSNQKIEFNNNSLLDTTFPIAKADRYCNNVNGAYFCIKIPNNDKPNTTRATANHGGFGVHSSCKERLHFISNANIFSCYIYQSYE
jgi:hypothetical protein